MKELLEYLGLVNDKRQEKKVWHKMGDIIALVFSLCLPERVNGQHTWYLVRNTRNF